ncbi:UNVERIFIED_CONTAM: hypothetical protein Sindi_3118800, partial [Sesamum indicum]
RSRSVGVAPLGGSRRSASFTPYGFARPLTRTHVRLLGPCFKTGRMGSPLASAGSAQLPRHAVGARCPPRIGATAFRGHIDCPGFGRRLNPRWSAPRADRRTGSRRSTSDRGASPAPHPLPSRQFQALFDSLFKVLFIFPSRYLFAIGLSPVFSLGRNLPPDWGCIPKQPDSPTAPRGAAGSGHDGALTLSGAPFQGTWARSAAEDASPDYNSDSEAARFSSWAVPGSLAVTRGILRVIPPDLGSRSEALAPLARELSVQPPLVVDERRRGIAFGPTARGCAREANVRPPRDGRGGDAMRDAQADVPWPNGFGRNLRSKTRWFTGFCNSHQVSHFATFFIDARAEISVAESRFDIRETSPPPVHPADGATVRRTLRSVFLGACRAGGSLARTSSAFARAGGGGDRTGAFAPRPGPDFICNVFAVCFCRFRQ